MVGEEEAGREGGREGREVMRKLQRAAKLLEAPLPYNCHIAILRVTHIES